MNGNDTINDYAVCAELRRKAETIDAANTQSGFGLGLWERRGGGHVGYLKPDHHTFSLYLGGGFQTRPVHSGEQSRAPGGSPGSISIIPAGSDTAWDNRGFVRWTHLYFRDDHLAHATDGRVLELAAATFICDPVARDLMQRFVMALDWHDNASEMALEHGLHALLARLALGKDRRPDPVSGGLTARQFRLVSEIVLERLDDRITLTDLADALGLSVRQFSRAFGKTANMPPYAWVLRQRVARARALLESGMSPAAVAAACGFSSQSHMSRRLRDIPS